MIAGSDTGNGLASSLMVRLSCSSSSSRASKARRVGSARAAKMRSRAEA